MAKGKRYENKNPLSSKKSKENPSHQRNDIFSSEGLNNGNSKKK